MKKLTFLLILIIVATSAIAKVKKTVRNPTDLRDFSSRGYKNNSVWCLEANAQEGVVKQQLSAPNFTAGYLNAINPKTGNLSFKNGISSCYDGQLGLFINSKRNLGLGVGYSHTNQQADLTLRNFCIEYQSKDFQGNVFRQVINVSNNQAIKESIVAKNTAIPLVIKYKIRFSEKLGIKTDAGVLFNIQQQNSFTTNASFDYEAVYKYVNNADGTNTTVYDNSPVPTNNNEWLITQAQYLQSNPLGMNKAFDSLRSQGYNVGLGINPRNGSGNTSYTHVSMGYLARAQLCYYCGDKFTINLGVYVSYQKLKNAVDNNYKLTDKVGDYNALINGVSSVNSLSYGASFGCSFYFGEPKQRPRNSTNKR